MSPEGSPPAAPRTPARPRASRKSGQRSPRRRRCSAALPHWRPSGGPRAAGPQGDGGHGRRDISYLPAGRPSQLTAHNIVVVSCLLLCWNSHRGHYRPICQHSTVLNAISCCPLLEGFRLIFRRGAIDALILIGHLFLHIHVHIRLCTIHHIIIVMSI